MFNRLYVQNIGPTGLFIPNVRIFNDRLIIIENFSASERQYITHSEQGRLTNLENRVAATASFEVIEQSILDFVQNIGILDGLLIVLWLIHVII